MTIDVRILNLPVRRIVRAVREANRDPIDWDMLSKGWTAYPPRDSASNASGICQVILRTGESVMTLEEHRKAGERYMVETYGTAAYRRWLESSPHDPRWYSDGPAVQEETEQK